MGCKRPSNEFGSSPPCTPNHRPASGSGAANVTFSEYPPYEARGTDYNIPEREDFAVMYDSVFVQQNTNSRYTSASSYDTPPSSHCGKLSQVGEGSSPYSFFTGTGTYYYSYAPVELSFDYGLSDTWFSYLYDAGSRGGTIGLPCYYLVNESSTITTTGASPGNDPVTGDPIPGESSSNTDDGTRCVPCTDVPCEAKEMLLEYTDNETDYTGDPDCPHPTLFAVDTRSAKIVIRYNQFSTTIPDGVEDFSFSYDGSTYTDVFDPENLYGTIYDTIQNPWGSGDVGFFDFQVFTMETDPTATGFRIKTSIQPIYDEDTQTFSGTRWTILELVSPGTGYSVGDTYQLSYDVTLDDDTTVTLTMNVKITQVGPREVTEGDTGFDRLRANDTLNGHTITRTFHTDLENFSYHVIYLDGSGSVFTKDGQYTSNRDHVVTVSAGYGIKDRAQLVGLYEFRNKSVQFQTVSQDPTAPNTFSNSIQPDAVGVVTNGQVTSVTINNGGSGWDLIDEDPLLVINSPPSASGTPARVQGIFTDGVLTGVTILDPGSGYSSTAPPFAWVLNQYKENVDNVANKGWSPTAADELTDFLDRIVPNAPADVRSSVREAINSTPKTQELPRVVSKVDVKKDFERDRKETLLQRLNKKSDMDPIVKEYSVKYDYTDLDDNQYLTSEFKGVLNQSREDDIENRKKLWYGMTQDVVPEEIVYKENLVETCIGSLSNLPYASENTKYLLKQYVPDTRVKTSINVTLICNMEDTGCGIATCTAPGLPADVNSTETDAEGNETNTVRTYTLSALLGPGCQNWQATGTIPMFNNLTGSAQRVAAAADANGNPYDEGHAN
jgi:hypothetical protein